MKGVIARSYELPLIIEAKKQLESNGSISRHLYNTLNFRDVLHEVCCNACEIKIRDDD